ncbi:MAG TPA: hypothetical protein PLD10_09055 [Rhodopila sp.]|nr:hypothetical protein [Rhodopila sp.]
MATISVQASKNLQGGLGQLLQRCDGFMPYAKALLLVTVLLSVWIGFRGA